MAGEWHGHGMLCVNRPLVDHKSQTEADVNADRQVLVYMKEKLDGEIVREVRNVSNSVAERKNQMESERQRNMLEFNKIIKEVNYLKARLVDGPTKDSQLAVWSAVGQVQYVANQGNS
jgi:hypothetical protein